MNKKHTFLLILQLLAVAGAGAASNDTAFVTINALILIGVIFNFLVSLNVPVGFIFGFAYAVTNGIIAFKTKVYATFAFMIFMQAPMAVYSFVKWNNKKSNGEKNMSVMNKKQLSLLSLFMILLGTIMYFILSMLRSGNVIFDDIFFVFSVSACLLLAMYFKNAYIITLLSGLFGTVLWSIQYFTINQGLSVAVFYFIALISSVIAVCQKYNILNDRSKSNES